MTIKDLDTETLTLLNKLINIWYIKSCPIDNNCQDCQLRELCYLLDNYDNDVKEELKNRGEC